MERIRVEQRSSVGFAWIAGWLFTIGYLKLGFWAGLLAIVIWSYDIGSHFSGLA